VKPNRGDGAVKPNRGDGVVKPHRGDGVVKPHRGDGVVKPHRGDGQLVIVVALITSQAQIVNTPWPRVTKLFVRSLVQ